MREGKKERGRERGGRKREIGERKIDGRLRIVL
jgi:hypothetical protein